LRPSAGALRSSDCHADGAVIGSELCAIRN
jgi:hypothetical protein